MKFTYMLCRFLGLYIDYSYYAYFILLLWSIYYLFSDSNYIKPLFVCLYHKSRFLMQFSIKVTFSLSDQLKWCQHQRDWCISTFTYWPCCVLPCTRDRRCVYCYIPAWWSWGVVNCRNTWWRTYSRRPVYMFCVWSKCYKGRFEVLGFHHLN